MAGTHSTDGREWARLSLLRPGDRLIPDGDFPCLAEGVPVTVRRGVSELFVMCAAGPHELEGQLADDGDHLVGLSLAPDGEPSQALLDVQAERRRQIEQEGWTPEHDDEAHAQGDLAQAAGCFALAASFDDERRADLLRGDDSRSAEVAALLFLSPGWDGRWLKLKTRRRELVIAAALALAEIERHDRAAAPEAGEGS